MPLTNGSHTMQSAIVLGNATSTVKHPSLENLKLLVCQPLQADGKTPDGAPLIAVDHLGAGRGETVMLTSDGGAVRETFGVENSPIRWSVLGLIDEATGNQCDFSPSPLFRGEGVGG